MKKKIISVFFAFILIFILKNYSNAANANIQCNNTATVNKPFSVTVTGSGVQWNLILKINGQVVASNNEFENVQGNKTISFSTSYTPTTTDNLQITLEGSVTEANDGSTIRNFSSKTVTVLTNSSNNSGTTKSNNANLGNLGIKPNDFSGFRAAKTSYDVTVPNNVSSINVYANKGHSGQTISGTGTKTLNVGTNTFNVLVTAEDGTTKKTYTINVTREGENSSETTKSNNANLKNLGIRPNDFSGFTANKTEYAVEVPNEVENIEIYAVKGTDGQTISGTGNKTLTEGENAFNVTVTAEDGTTKKIYTINIRRKAKDETTNTEESEDTTDNTENGEEQPKEVFGLSELGITGFDLDPEFKTDIFEYKLQLKEDKDKLDIITVATEANSNITITGNENLKNGENIITILVTNETGDKTATYQITVNKDIETKDNTIAEEQERIQQEKQKKIIILSASAAFVVIVGVIAIIVIIKKSKASTVQIPYSNLYDEDEEENDGYVENPIDYNKYNLNQEKSEEQIKNTEENEFDYENQYKDEFDYENQEENRKNRHRKGKRFK